MKGIAVALCLIFVAASAPAGSPGSPATRREEVRFRSGYFELAGDLLLPDSAAVHPAVIYVWGSGPTDRRRHIENSPVIGAMLDAGFAVLLYDKPGSGESTGEFDNRRLFAQRASILADAIAWLRQHPAIEPRAIGLYGSSQASYVVTAALEADVEIAFLVAWSWPMQNSIEQSAYLVRNYVLCEGGTPQLADAAQDAYLRRGQATTYAGYRAAAEALESIAAIRDGLGWAGIVPEEEFTPLDPASESLLDPGTAARMRFPVLALFAANDRQIDPLQGADAFRRAFAADPDPLSTVVVIPGADHNMNLSARGCIQDQADGYRSVGGRKLSPDFIQTLSEWLRRLERSLPGS